ncbi:MAG: FecR domain-containing protein [Ferruginibacter sp.]|nr:FecR domain-containing protein [Ferruginibacter sp.]
MEKHEMTEKELHQKLVERYCENKASDKELVIFFQLLKEGKLDEMMVDSMKAGAGAEHIGEEKKMGNKNLVTRIGWRRIAVAVTIVILSLAGINYLFNNNPGKGNGVVASKAVIKKKLTNDAAPGSNKAVLTLANGNTIILDSVNNGTLAQQGAAKIDNKDGQLIYNDKIKENGGEIVYNKMETQRGGQYQLILADGSKVWLNASSSIRFPTVFSGIERVVEITGEVYFEVAKNAAMPFRVKINTDSGNRGEVEVLGTHFNINAYSNEAAVKSTLLEGSIKLINTISVNEGSKQVILKPGQQANLNKQGLVKICDNTDLEEVVAWKNGMFQFNKASIEIIMRQVERWYDVDVVYVGAKPAGHYRGEISRNVNASEMLKILQTSGIRFNIDNGKIMVMP